MKQLQGKKRKLKINNDKGIISKNNFILALLGAKCSRKNVPLLVFFTITNKCNASCSYCFGKYYERYGVEGDKELTTGQILSIIDELAVIGTQRIGLSGGEPLLREDIGEIIAYINKKGIGCGLNTNGFLVPEKIEDISTVDNITISLDGDKDAHEANRGRGTFEKVMEAIRVIKKSKIPLHVSTVITRNNINSIGYIMELAREIGFLAQVSPLYGRFWGGAGNNFPEPLDKQEFIEVINQVISYKKKGYPVFYSYRTYKNILDWPDLTKDRIAGREPKFNHAKCYMGKYLCTIDANGDVYPCAQLNGFKVKNCLEVGFREAFNSISEHDCKACLWACYNEYNLLFGLNFNVILNALRNTRFVFS